MNEPVQFMCEGCGIEVNAFGIETVPHDYFCLTCHWLNDMRHSMTPDAFWDAYQLFQRDVTPA